MRRMLAPPAPRGGFYSVRRNTVCCEGTHVRLQSLAVVISSCHSSPPEPSSDVHVTDATARVQLKQDWVHSAFKFEIDPNDVQRSLLAGHCMAKRVAWNWMLERVKSDIDAHNADPAHTSVGWTSNALRKAWSDVKAEHFPQWHLYAKDAYESAAVSLSRALMLWKARSKGRRVGFPRFKRSMHGYNVGGDRAFVRDDRHIRITVVGVLRTKESTRKLRRLLDSGQARIYRASVSTRAGRWYVSFNVEMFRPAATPLLPDSVVGVDVGVKHLAVVVSESGEVVERFANPRPLSKAERRLNRYNRMLSRRRSPGKGGDLGASNRWRKQREKTNRLHKRVADRRLDACHKASTRVARTHGTMVVEKLNVSGMLRNKRLAKAIADSGMGRIRPLLESKAPRFGSKCVVVDLWFPSSKLCSGCGSKNETLTLNTRRWTCTSCGAAHDRDENAARNLARHRTASAAETCPGDGANARGEDVSPRSARQTSTKREARSSQAGRKTSGASTQDEVEIGVAKLRALIGLL